MKKLSEVLALKNYNGGRTPIILSTLDYTSITVKPQALEDVVGTIKRKENRPLKSRIINDYESGLILPVFSPEGLMNVPSFVPMWGTKVDNKVAVAFNISQFASQDENRNIKISVKTMFGFMLGASVARAIAVNPNILASHKLLKHLVTIYVRIFTKILDKNFAITANSLHFDQIKYVCAKFFILSVLGLPDNDTNRTIAASVISASSEPLVKAIDNETDSDIYNDIESFLGFLSGHFTRLSKLSYRLVLNDLVKMYKAPTLLILEYAPYFIANILYVLVASNINNEYVFENVLGKDGIEVYKELDRLL